MSALLVKGLSYQAILDPKLWLSPALMVGSKAGVSYSTEKDSRDSNILTFEGQVYLRWNFLTLGSDDEDKINVFVQGGLGLISAYRGEDRPLDDVTKTRGSLLADAAIGVTIPLTARWHIEPLIRGGYPHLGGFSITAGYKFPLPQKTEYRTQTDYREIIKTLPPEEIIKVVVVTMNEFILFGPDIGKYNVGIDHDAQGLNELVLNSVVQKLKENPDLRVRIEGHANPVTTDPKEADELMALSAMRSKAVADQLKARGIREEQMIVISFGGTRTVTHDHQIWNRNRRVELIVFRIENE
ncbi:MAG: OmpA family protein [Spirochaetaceae bacterium]|nr:OmpA family protein [Spirochaetaceae bacterium]